MAPAGGGNIKVVVRVRPFNSRGAREILFFHNDDNDDDDDDDTNPSQNWTETQNASSR